MDNIFVERLWRALKYERIYLNTYETGAESNGYGPRWPLPSILPNRLCSLLNASTQICVLAITPLLQPILAVDSYLFVARDLQPEDRLFQIK